MSIPNFENIDKWLFEFTEGNLSAEQESTLLDFLELHPELMPELKAWNAAKVKASVHPQFSTQSLLKATPFLLRPYALVSIALILLMFTWFGIGMIPVTPLYVKAEIDTEIINTEIEDTDVFINQLLAISSNNKNANTENDLNKKATLESQAQAQKSQQSNSTDLVQSVSINELASTNETVLKQNSGIQVSESRNEISLTKEVIQANKTIQENLANAVNPLDEFEDINSITANNDYNLNIQELDLLAINEIKIKANDLDKISDYLNHKDEFDNPNSIDENLALNTGNASRTISSSSASKSTFKKSIATTFRKIKKMADYPVALQNTKNPNFHVPMMTGYKANFAMVGTAPGNRIQATSRAQWLNETNSQLMNSLSWDGYVYNVRGGLGIDVNYNNYQNNEINNYSAAVTYSPKFSINKKISFEPALQFKMGVINIDQQSNSIGNPIEIERNNIVPLFTEHQKVNGQQLWYKDIGLGFMVNTEWFYAGFDADNIGRHNNNYFSGDIEKEYRSDVHYTAVFGTEYASNTKEMSISGYGLYQKYGDLEEFWLGTNFRYEWMQIGVAASSKLDMAASLGTVFNNFSFHYNIDYSESRLLGKPSLSHQVTLKILLKPSRYVAKYLKR